MKKHIVKRVHGFRENLREAVRKEGGACNGHAHLDRNNTFESIYFNHYGMSLRDATRATLEMKQGFVGILHSGLAYTSSNLESRMRASLEVSIACGVIRVVSCIDATPDIGLRAIEVALRLKHEYAEQILFKIVPHPIFGWKDDAAFPVSRWDIFKEACALCDGVGSLPERDDRPGSIGSVEHLRRSIMLGKELGKPVYVHVGQANDFAQRDIFDLIEAVKWLDYCASPHEVPKVWAVHAISPSAFSEADFAEVLAGLVKYRIGVICCPRAAVSMRQNRARPCPTHNSIARVLEMALVGVPIMLGTDNTKDIFVPTSDEDMIDQAVVLADLLRFYEISVLAKWVAGVVLNDSDREAVRQCLLEDVRVFKRTDPKFAFCMPL